jgi:cardiolipin synthase
MSASARASGSAEYEDGFLHQQVMLIDVGAATVGPVNFDNRSFPLNFEITTVVTDRDSEADVEAMLKDDFRISRLMDGDEYDRKPW